MPPRYAYWTIIAGGLPTAFRAAEREELLPTFTRLRGKHPDAEMKWFARGKLWDTPDAARRDTDARRGDSARRGDQDRPARSTGGPRERERRGDGEGGPARGRDWRPGGEHRDPRQPYIDAKKVRNQDRRKEKFARKHGAGDDGAGTRPPKPQWSKPREDRFSDRPRGESSRSDRPRRDARTDGPARSWDKPRGDRPAAPKGSWSGNRDRGRRAEAPAGRDDRPRERDTRDRGPRERFSNDSRPAKPQWSKPHGTAAPKGGWSGDRDRGRRPEAPAGRSDRPREQDSRERAPRDRFRDDARPPKAQWSKPRADRGRDRPREDAPPGNRPAGPAAKPHWKAPREEGFRARPREDGPQPERPPREDRGHGQKPQWNRSPDTRPRDRGPRPPGGGTRPFEPRGFARSQGTEEPPPPPRPRGPNREPRPSETPEPTPPPRPSEPVTTPPGPPERGRLVKRPRRS